MLVNAVSVRANCGETTELFIKHLALDCSLEFMDVKRGTHNDSPRRRGEGVNRRGCLKGIKMVDLSQTKCGTVKAAVNLSRLCYCWPRLPQCHRQRDVRITTRLCLQQWCNAM